MEKTMICNSNFTLAGFDSESHPVAIAIDTLPFSLSNGRFRFGRDMYDIDDEVQSPNQALIFVRDEVVYVNCSEGDEADTMSGFFRFNGAEWVPSTISETWLEERTEQAKRDAIWRAECEAREAQWEADRATVAARFPDLDIDDGDELRATLAGMIRASS